MTFKVMHLASDVHLSLARPIRLARVRTPNVFYAGDEYRRTGAPGSSPSLCYAFSWATLGRRKLARPRDHSNDAFELGALCCLLLAHGRRLPHARCLGTPPGLRFRGCLCG